MDRASFLVCSAILITLLTQCESNRGEISESGLKKLKQNYSEEAINYFYETVFFQDYVGKKDSLSKWQHDIWIHLEGTLWANDTLYVREVVDELNVLNLPIRLHTTKDEPSANLIVYFGDFSYLEEKLGIKVYPSFRGIGRITDPSPSKMSAVVGIANNAASYDSLTPEDKEVMRRSIILEEITQILGIPGDSWKYYESVFFEGKKKVLALQNIDKEVIKLLYEPAVPAKLSRLNFEGYFKDILYSFDAKGKLVSVAQKNEIPNRYFENIRNYSFLDNTLFKYPRHVFVKLEGDYQQYDLEFCRNAIKLLNTASDQLRLELVKGDIWHDLPSITIQYNDSSRHTMPKVERFMEPGAMMLTRCVRAKIKLSYGKPDVPQESINKLLFQAMYKVLGFDGIGEEVVEFDAAKQLQFKPGYKEMLSFLYNPAIPDGFTQKEMDEVIRALE